MSGQLSKARGGTLSGIFAGCAKAGRHVACEPRERPSPSKGNRDKI